MAKSQPDLGGPQADLANALLAAGRDRGRDHRLLRGPAPGPGIGAGLLRPRASPIKGSSAGTRRPRRSERPSSWRPIRPSARYNLGLALSALGERDDARAALLRAAALEPDDVGIREALQALLVPAAAVDDAPSAPAAPVPRFGGDIETFALPEVLEFLRLQNKTGSLVVSSRRGAAIVRLVHGRVTSASAPGVSRLGESAGRARDHHRRRRWRSPSRASATDDGETVGSARRDAAARAPRRPRAR